MALELNIYERLDRILPTLQDAQFLSNKGIGNEIGFHIFDYEPEHELLVRDFVQKLLVKLEKPEVNLPTLEINLFQLALDILKERNFLEKAIQMEQKKGKEALHKALKPVLRPDKLAELIAERLEESHRMVFLTGIGAAWPLVRSHSILNNLHATMDKVPLVVFFPGSYDGHELRLFSTLHDDNYYRAFQLVPRTPMLERGHV